MFWMQKHSQSMITMRAFSSAGHGHDDHHDDHGHHVEKADPDFKFIAQQDKKYIAFNGLRATTPNVLELDNPYRHHNDLPLYKYG